MLNGIGDLGHFVPRHVGIPSLDGGDRLRFCGIDDFKTLLGHFLTQMLGAKHENLRTFSTDTCTMRAATTDEVMTCQDSTSKSNPFSWSATTA